MEELYRSIEKKIMDSGYPEPVDGSLIYRELSEFVDGKENGSYLFLSRHANEHLFEYQIQVMEEQFNLSTLTITAPEQIYTVNFDEA